MCGVRNRLSLLFVRLVLYDSRDISARVRLVDIGKLFFVKRFPAFFAIIFGNHICAKRSRVPRHGRSWVFLRKAPPRRGWLLSLFYYIAFRGCNPLSGDKWRSPAALRGRCLRVVAERSRSARRPARDPAKRLSHLEGGQLSRLPQ